MQAFEVPLQFISKVVFPWQSYKFKSGQGQG
uniref:Uncharacterized protein n=1 Tax=Rhizophora mucronata TaxID=61149 RepID=A0A2P2NE85_RHIMU